MQRMDEADWARLFAGVQELSALFPDGIVFIGGVAVLLHVRDQHLPPRFVELSHDGDFYVSLSDFADLRDLEEVTANRRLDKHQIIKDGFEYDVYLEDHNSLRVRFVDVLAASTVVDGVRLASLEHLLILKLDAYASRRGSAKGRKDERDLVKITYLMRPTGPRPALLAGYLTLDDAAALDAVRRSSEIMDLCGGNAHEARELRSAVGGVVDAIQLLARGEAP